MVSLYIYSILITIVALILIWILYRSNEEFENLKISSERTINYIREIYDGNINYCEEKIKQYEKQIWDDNDLIDELRKENQKLKGDRW